MHFVYLCCSHWVVHFLQRLILSVISRAVSIGKKNVLSSVVEKRDLDWLESPVFKILPWLPLIRCGAWFAGTSILFIWMIRLSILLHLPHYLPKKFGLIHILIILKPCSALRMAQLCHNVYSTWKQLCLTCCEEAASRTEGETCSCEVSQPQNHVRK